MTKIDCLIEVAKKLREARSLAERSSDRALLYFIDMTLAHVCDSLDARSETKGAEDKHASTRQSRCVSARRRSASSRGPTSATRQA
jgi:hypothetical protein